MPYLPCNRRREQGAALVVAMLVFALCTALIVAMKSEFTRFYQRGANLFLAEQAYAYLRGGEDLARMALLVDYDMDKADDKPRDDLEEIWAQPPAPYALDEGGWLKGSLADLQGRFNLNALVGRVASEGAAPQGAARYTAAQAQFIRLLQALDEPEISEQDARLITESIGDWLDGDGSPLPNGAEDDYYFGLTPAYRAANRPMASVSELRSVAYVTAELYVALQDVVTVWPRDPGTLNIHTAPALVLRSISADGDLSPLGEEEGEALLATREEGGFEDIDGFLAHPVFDDKRDRMEKARTLLGEASTCFLLEAEVEVADRNMRLYSVLERRGRSVSALARASGSL
jgi:general secretion pathway protein K